jgi:hypothetical protein
MVSMAYLQTEEVLGMLEGSEDEPPSTPGPLRKQGVKVVAATLSVALLGVVVVSTASGHHITPTMGRAFLGKFEDMPDTSWSEDGTPEYRLTQKLYTDTDHAHACSQEYGDSFAVADWDQDMSGLGADAITDMCDALGIKTTFNEKNIFVTKQGESYYDGGDRAFFFERHGGHPPDNWLVHDQQGAITLGSWYDIEGPVLCVARKAAADPTFPTAAQPIMGKPNVSWSDAGSREFRLTQHLYTDTDHGHACSLGFGDAFAIADWDRDMSDLGAVSITDMCNALGIKKSFNENNIFVTRGGETYADDSHRAFFFERHDGHPPGNWLVHDQHGAITLGSWYGIEGPVLCVARKAASHTTEQPIAREPNVSWSEAGSTEFRFKQQ